ncbi:MAG TPA: hypothetical protein VGI13_02075 [Candidatus Acidoferrum sp.]
MKKVVMIATLLSVGVTAQIPFANAQSSKGTLVKVPFAFVAGNQAMPAGTYKIEAVTKGKPGVDAVEVVTLRGRDVKSYASFVTVLGSAENDGPKMTFKRTEAKAILMEVQGSGKSFVLPRSSYDAGLLEANYHFEVIPADQEGSFNAGGRI